MKPQYRPHRASPKRLLLFTLLLLLAGAATAAVSVIDRRALVRLTDTVDSLDRQITQLTTIIEGIDLLNDLTGREDPVVEYRTQLAESLEEAGDPAATLIADYHERLAYLAADETDQGEPFADVDSARAYALDYFFVPYQDTDEAIKAVDRGAIAQRNRLTALAITSVNAWSLGAVTHNALGAQTERHNALAQGFQDTASLREEVSVLTAATLEAIDAQLLHNTLYATQLELQAMTAITASPPVLDEATTAILSHRP